MALSSVMVMLMLMLMTMGTHLSVIVVVVIIIPSAKHSRWMDKCNTRRILTDIYNL